MTKASWSFRGRKKANYTPLNTREVLRRRTSHKRLLKLPPLERWSLCVARFTGKPLMADLNPLLASLASSQEDKLNMKQRRVRNSWIPLSVTLADCDILLGIMVSAPLLPNTYTFLSFAYLLPRENDFGAMFRFSHLDITPSGILFLNLTSNSTIKEKVYDY